MTLFSASIKLCPFYSFHCAPQDLIDRLIAVNSDAKMNSLFHYEQSHTFGLRLGDFLFYLPLYYSTVVGKRVGVLD